MKSHLIKEEIKQLQIRYREILLKAKDNIFNDDSIAVIDEINVFWYKNKKLIELFLKSFLQPYNAYVFTAATILDVEDFEHYPFVTLGKFHIWDDPIYLYANIAGKAQNSTFDEKIKKQIIDTINDTLKIIEIADEIIYILPLRFLANDSSQLLHDTAMEVFLSLFNNDYSFKEYLENIHSIEDVKHSLRPGIENSIIFLKNEDSKLGFEKRFAKYKDSTVLPIPKDVSDAKIFWFAIVGYLMQALDVINICTRYQVNPYIRFEVTFTYMLILSINFKDQKEIQEMIFKSAIAYKLHMNFNKDKVKNIDFKRFYLNIQKLDFDNMLFSKLKEQEVTIDSRNAKLADEIIDDLLESLY